MRALYRHHGTRQFHTVAVSFAREIVLGRRVENETGCDAQVSSIQLRLWGEGGDIGFCFWSVD